MLGLGMGIAALDPDTGDNASVTSLSIGAGTW